MFGLPCYITHSGLYMFFLLLRLAFQVLHLERRVEGSNLPLPKTLIRSLLNMVMPSVSALL